MQSTARNTIVGLALVTAALLSGCASMAASDPGMSTWKLNVEKSRFSPGPAPRSLVATFEPTADGGVRLTAAGVAADGRPIATEYIARYDGKDYPLKGSAVADTVVLRRIDARTIERLDKKAGKVVQTQTRVISPDGKTSTIAVKGTTASGAPIDNLLFLEKQ